MVLAARSGYDPFSLLDVLTTVDSIDPDAENLTVLTNTHLLAGQRLRWLAETIDDKRYGLGAESNTRRAWRRAAC